ncbi:hypothetical protein HHK36_027951 [Tetracentron sinense]|uniref:Pectinesterase inhibitor domain-containing protein n=1 Tax=Tetracentron sinense TaxID=13715 RepID=A0A834YHJ6_TETSI|nr:hypothetical protein HHK36_027951 [Tetracentron sinense]
MARLTLPLLLILLSILHIATTAQSTSTVPKRSGATDFIKASCRTTRYPALCVQSLSVFATAIQRSSRQLAHTALSVSLSRARSATVFVSKMARIKGMKGREYEAVKDCVDNMGDSVDRLSRSLRELGHMGGAGGQDFMWHISNVQTWVSAALTDESTCVDGFAGRAMDGRVKASIKGRVVNVAQVTSNALALVNHFAAKH